MSVENMSDDNMSVDVEKTSRCLQESLPFCFAWDSVRDPGPAMAEVGWAKKSLQFRRRKMLRSKERAERRFETFLIRRFPENCKTKNMFNVYI